MTTTEVLPSLIGWLLTASVKGTILIVLVAAVQWILRDRIPSRWRYAMWLLVMLRLAVPIAPASGFSLFNLFEIPSPNLSEIELVHAPLPADVASGRPVEVAAELSPPRLELTRYAMVAGGIWLAGFAILALRLAITSLRLHRQLDRERPSEVARETRALLDECRRQFAVRQAVLLRETGRVRSPALHGILRPVLLLPAGLTQSFTTDELRFVFLHELAHLKRFDVAANWAIAAVQIIHWFNPLVWLAAMRMQEERELACDELALCWLQQEERFGYGRTILKLLDRFRTPAPVPALLGFLHDHNQLKRRLLMITRFRTHPRFSFLFLALLVGLGLVTLTDARAGERLRLLEPLDPAARATLETLDQKVSVELTDVSLSDFLATISSLTGVAVTPVAELAADGSTQKRISISAEQVPAHLVLIETLGALELDFNVKAEGVTVKKGPPRDGLILFREPSENAPGAFERRIEKKVIMPADAHEPEMIAIESNGTPEEAEETIAVLEGRAPAEIADERVFVRKVVPGQHTMSADGTIRRNLVIKTKENGVESLGKLQIELRNATN